MKKQTKKIILYGDSPFATTGLGKLHKYLAEALVKEGHELWILGVNHTPVWYDQKQYPFRIIPTQMTPDQQWGKQTFVELIKKEKFDIIITSHDFSTVAPFVNEIVTLQKTRGTKWISYTPVDSLSTHEYEAKLLQLPDASLLYSRFAKEVFDRILGKKYNKSRTLYLPLDLDLFKPLSKEDRIKKYEYRKELWGWEAKHFVITNVNRHQFRKDLGRTIEVFKKFYQYNKNARLYLHTPQRDVGGDIGELLLECGVDLQSNPDLVKCAPHQFAVNGISDEEMVRLYQASDVVVSTSRGEGYGYSTVEAMACGIPFIGGDNTTFPEMLGRDGERGLLAGNLGWVHEYGHGMNDHMIARRALVDPDVLFKRIKQVYQSSVDLQKMTINARLWVEQNIEKDMILGKWLEIIGDLSKK